MPAVNPGAVGLVSWWALEETSGNRADSHGSNTLTDVNTVGSAAGKVGIAADFETSATEELKAADNSDLSIGGNGPMTIGAWVYAESMADDRGVMGKWSAAGPGSEYVLAAYNAGFVFAARNSSDTQVTIFESTVGAPATATWYFVVAWYDPADGKLRIQVNNQIASVSASALSGGIRDGSQTFRLGGYNLSSPRWDGLIDEAFLSKRVYTADEREWLYNSGSGRSYTEVNPQGQPAAIRGVFVPGMMSGGRTIIRPGWGG